MKPSILHISDLHRDPGNPIRNDVLLDSLENDRRHYSAEETPAVRSPDLMIVSGDIIHGIKPEAPDPEHKLRKQYQEALNFLARLTDRFVQGDRNRVIVVPGNHDVSAYHFERSLRRVDVAPDRKKAWSLRSFRRGRCCAGPGQTSSCTRVADQALYAQAPRRLTMARAPTTLTRQDRSTFSIFPRLI